MDPLTGGDVYLSATARTEREAEKELTQLLAKVDKQRSAVTRATLAYALDAWLEVHEGEAKTIEGYRTYIERIIKPALGDVPLAKHSPRTLEQFYAQLRRCRIRCNGKPFVEHATSAASGGPGLPSLLADIDPSDRDQRGRQPRLLILRRTDQQRSSRWDR